MHYAYWGLKHSPFSSGFAARRIFESSIHEEAVARLLYLVENRKRLGLLLGETGLGKSLLLEVFATHLKDSGLPAARLNLAAIDRDEVPGLLAEQFRISITDTTSATVAWRRLLGFLSELVYQQQSAVILLDDVDQADKDTLKIVTRLMHTEAAIAGRLTIVLALQTARLSVLPESLLDAAELRIDLEKWSSQDTAGYLHMVLLEAGRVKAAFDNQAVARIHELSGGIPRRAAQMADLALLAGAARRLELVDASVIDEVAAELQPGLSVAIANH